MRVARGARGGDVAGSTGLRLILRCICQLHHCFPPLPTSQLPMPHHALAHVSVPHPSLPLAGQARRVLRRDL